MYYGYHCRFARAVGERNWLIEECVKGLTPEQLHWLPSGNDHSVAASYAHAVPGQDMVVHGMIQGKAPLAATT